MGYMRNRLLRGLHQYTVWWVYENPAMGDIDKDGDADAALILVSTSGGSGTFYHAANCNE